MTAFERFPRHGEGSSLTGVCAAVRLQDLWRASRFVSGSVHAARSRDAPTKFLELGCSSSSSGGALRQSRGSDRAAAPRDLQRLQPEHQLLHLCSGLPAGGHPQCHRVRIWSACELGGCVVFELSRALRIFWCVFPTQPPYAHPGCGA